MSFEDRHIKCEQSYEQSLETLSARARALEVDYYTFAGPHVAPKWRIMDGVRRLLLLAFLCEDEHRKPMGRSRKEGRTLEEFKNTRLPLSDIAALMSDVFPKKNAVHYHTVVNELQNCRVQVRKLTPETLALAVDTERALYTRENEATSEHFIGLLTSARSLAKDLRDVLEKRMESSTNKNTTSRSTPLRNSVRAPSLSIASTLPGIQAVLSRSADAKELLPPALTIQEANIFDKSGVFGALVNGVHISLDISKSDVLAQQVHMKLKKELAPLSSVANAESLPKDSLLGALFASHAKDGVLAVDIVSTFPKKAGKGVREKMSSRTLLLSR